jgi:hypothetical protein
MPNVIPCENKEEETNNKMTSGRSFVFITKNLE